VPKARSSRATMAIFTYQRDGVVTEMSEDKETRGRNEVKKEAERGSPNNPDGARGRASSDGNPQNKTEHTRYTND